MAKEIDLELVCEAMSDAERQTWMFADGDPAPQDSAQKKSAGKEGRI